MNSSSSPALVAISNTRIDDDSGLAATGHASPRLSWALETDVPGVIQTGYEIQVSSSEAFDGFVEQSGFVAEPRPYLAPWPAAPMGSRDVRWWRVRAHTNIGQTEWSEPCRVEASLLSPSDWIARPISPVSNVGRQEIGPSPLLRRAFDAVGRIASARLYVTALGVHDVQINGQPISADLLEPGWTVYPKRLLFSAYDVTSLLRDGPNVISAAIGDGWFRGDMTWFLKRNSYGETTALLAQLEVVFEDGSRLLVPTDQAWKGSTGAVREAEIYHGSTFDFRLEEPGWRLPGFDDTHWEAVAELGLPAGLEPRDMPAVRVVERREIALPADRRPGAPILLDTGQNLTGYLAITASGPAGARITIRHAEILDNDGSLYTAALRGARATDTYILDGSGARELRPAFTFHGFRYAEIEASDGVVIEAVTAEVIASDLVRTGHFSCSDERVNQLYNNVVWSQRGNFLALPTDCPQRDERLGWTGDIQVFAPTAALNADCRTFLRSWLKDLRLEQREDGCVPITAPNLLGQEGIAFGSAVWGDAASCTPWDLFAAFGDTEIISANYQGMKAWVNWCQAQTDEAGAWVKGFQFGDWLDPDAPADKPYQAKTHHGFIATSYLAHSAALVSRAAELVGDTESIAQYAALSARSREAAWERWGAEAIQTPTGCALAIEFDIAPSDRRAEIGQRLADLVKANRFRVATGFVGTPLVLPALTRTGHLETAYGLLLNRDCPGWLYQIDAGATTIWERWDAVKPDGRLHTGELQDAGSSMISFNHYAYGAVAAWFYRTIAGLNIDLTLAPDRQFVLAPQPGGGLTSARASVMTPYGTLALDWRQEQLSLHVELEIPAGATAQFVVPSQYATPGRGRAFGLGSGRHSVSLSRG